MSFKDLLNEAILSNTPGRGLEIRPSGGLGSWTEDALVLSLSKQLSELSSKMKARDYTGVEYILFKNGSVKSKIVALARFEEFKTKRGRRPIAQGAEIDLGEAEMKFQALAMAKELHSQLADLTFIEMLGVMSADNPAKKEVQELETKINQLTTEVGAFIQKYIPDVADAEAGDISEIPPEEDDTKPTAKKPVAKPKEKPVQVKESFNDITNLIFKTLFVKEYEEALEMLKNGDKSISQISKIYKHVDSRTLSSMAKELKLVSEDEPIKFTDFLQE